MKIGDNVIYYPIAGRKGKSFYSHITEGPYQIGGETCYKIEGKRGVVAASHLEVSKRQRIGTVKNFYGGIWITKEDGKCYWCIEDHGYYPAFAPFDQAFWKEISQELYNELKNHKSKQ